MKIDSTTDECADLAAFLDALHVSATVGECTSAKRDEYVQRD
jgi:hypothetical protein